MSFSGRRRWATSRQERRAVECVAPSVDAIVDLENIAGVRNRHRRFHRDQQRCRCFF